MNIKKILIVLIAIFIMLSMFELNNVQAVLQASGSTGTTKNLSDWLLAVRQMEEIGGVFGLSETISDDLTSSNGSNNLDCHMQKNTEYGAMAILSASAYGNPNKINDGETTTGNKSGIYMNLNKEWVSAGQLTRIPRYTNAKGRYKNIYSTSYIPKIGDAIVETKGWHGSSISIWINSDQGGLVRAFSDSVFSYHGNSFYNSSTDVSYADPANSWNTRAVVVVGEGF